MATDVIYYYYIYNCSMGCVGLSFSIKNCASNNNNNNNNKIPKM
jgi:hypothetical protein